MRIDRLLTSVFALILCFGPARVSRGDEREDAASSWEKYKVIAQRNVFLRDRSRPGSQTGVAAPPVYRPESAFMLTGVVRQGEEYIALLEDTRRNVTSRVRIGDSVADGLIVGITLDAIVYEKNDQTAQIEVGKRLAEVPSTQPSAGASAGEGEGGIDAERGAAPSAASAGGGDADSILERLRQRREKELNSQ